MMGGINSSMQNRMALVDERFISEALGSFVANADHPLDSSAEPFQTQILLEILAGPIWHFLICRNFCETDSLAANWFFAEAETGRHRTDFVPRAALPVKLVRIAT